ncbi:hypothetical protein LTR16_007322, partial [Cryomyces antarcticus]
PRHRDAVPSGAHALRRADRRLPVALHGLHLRRRLRLLRRLPPRLRRRLRFRHLPDRPDLSRHRHRYLHRRAHGHPPRSRALPAGPPAEDDAGPVDRRARAPLVQRHGRQRRHSDRPVLVRVDGAAGRALGSPRRCGGAVCVGEPVCFYLRRALPRRHVRPAQRRFRHGRQRHRSLHPRCRVPALHCADVPPPRHRMGDVAAGLHLPRHAAHPVGAAQVGAGDQAEERVRDDQG